MAHFVKGERILERFEIDSVLGAGGFGTVYKARQLATGQWVAIKVLNHAMLEDQARRFDAEMGVLAKLNHAHTVKLIDRAVLDTHAVMVLEYVEGPTLKQLLRERGPLSPKVSVRIIAQILESLDEAHAMGIVHRDLKPGNIILSGPPHRPSAKLLDFGIAAALETYDGEWDSITTTGSVTGTPSYIDPETLLPDDDGRHRAKATSDIYAVGLLLFECLTGVKAMNGKTPHEVYMRQVRSPLPMPSRLRAHPLGEVLRTACKKNARSRYQSAEEMLEALGAIANLEDDPLFHNINVAEEEVNSAQTPIASLAQSPIITELVEPDEPDPTYTFQHDDFAASGGDRQGKLIAIGAVAIGAVLIGATILGFMVMGSSSNENAAAADLAAEVSFDIVSTPAGATILIDDEPRGVTPKRLTYAVTAPPVSLTLRLDGHQDLDVTIVPSSHRAGDVVNSMSTLRADAITTTTWQITSTPSGAKISLNDELAGTTPFTLDKPQGARDPLTITASLAGHSPSTIELPTDGGDVEIALRPDKVGLKKRGKPQRPKPKSKSKPKPPRAVDKKDPSRDVDVNTLLPPAF